MHYEDYTQTLHNYVYGQWILNGASFFILAIFAFAGIYLGVEGIRHKYTLWRTSKMTPERYAQWQASAFADRLVKVGEELVKARIYTPREMNQLLTMIGHRCSIWDLVPKERVTRGPVSVLKALIRKRTEELKKEKQTLGQKLGEELHNKVNGFPKPGDQ